jgi:hypothetical protein
VAGTDLDSELHAWVVECVQVELLQIFLDLWRVNPGWWGQMRVGTSPPLSSW